MKTKQKYYSTNFFLKLQITFMRKRYKFTPMQFLTSRSFSKCEWNRKSHRNTRCAVLCCALAARSKLRTWRR